MNVYRSEALALRKAGYSYAMISERLGVSKSTLSNWLSGVPFTPSQELIERVGNAKLKSALYKHRLKLESIERAKMYAENDEKALHFWCQETGLFADQFNKMVIDRRENKSKFNKGKLPNGTFRLYVKSSNNKHSGVHLHRKILAWIERCLL